MTKRIETVRALERRAALAQAIKRFRGSLTQAELGKVAGVPQTTVSRWEKELVDLSYEQVRAIEIGIGLPLGTIGCAAGFVEPGISGEAGFRIDFYDSFDDAKDTLEAAAALNLGVHISNRWRVDKTDDTLTEQWVVVLSQEPTEVER